VTLPSELAAALERLGIVVADRTNARSVAGGSISRTLRLETRGGPVFVKLEPRDAEKRLEAEAAGLEAIANTGAVPVPAVLGWGTAAADAFLVLEWIELGTKTPAAERKLGDALAAMHRNADARFGWASDNFIGRTPQANLPMSAWPEFFRKRRLEPQLELGRRNGLGGEALRLAGRVVDALDDFFAGHAPVPSLVHGDLWGGNWGAARDGTPYVFDPAAYYGDREADIAMTRLFGGFGDAFYRAYDAAWPPAPGRDRRTDLYNLYHLLNHFNLFGGAYRAEVIACLERLLGRVMGH
jgi:protein-ribulosamine 3-kinase